MADKDKEHMFASYFFLISIFYTLLFPYFCFPSQLSFCYIPKFSFLKSLSSLITNKSRDHRNARENIWRMHGERRRDPTGNPQGGRKGLRMEECTKQRIAKRAGSRRDTK